MSAAQIAALEQRHRELEPLAIRFSEELAEQLKELMETADVALSFPIQRRVKSWASIAEKIERKTILMTAVLELTDLIGLRLILQFRRDVDRVCQLIDQNFRVRERYDTHDRLREDQFGYSSIHFVVAMPESWLSVPTLKNMGDLHAEIQVRTTAQHIWASASHTLQYKREESVPVPIRRAIHRVSALLETVDLEFTRVLEERDQYVASLATPEPDEQLNVDSLRDALRRNLPASNADRYDDYSGMLADLLAFGIRSRGELEVLILRHTETALAEDRYVVELFEQASAEATRYVKNPRRLARGVFYTHVGLVRQMMSHEFGARWQKHQDSKVKPTVVEDDNAK